MAETFTPDLGLDNFNTALFTDHTAVLHAFVFSAVTFVILGGTENLRTEQTFSLGLECPVVDGFGFFDLTERPLPDLFRRGQ